MSGHKLYAEISKVDDNGDGTIDVHGVASTEAKDAQGETVTKGCMEDALPDYFAHGTGALRAMHQPIAAGYVYKAEVNSDGQTLISAKVVDPVEVLKCTTGVYKGFSIGGKKVPGGYDAATKTITKMKLTEISLVDRPANPEATITMWKGEDMEQQSEQVVDIEVTKAAEKHIDELAAMINKGEISPEKLVELAAAEIAKAAAAPVLDDSKLVAAKETFLEEVEKVAAKEQAGEVARKDDPEAIAKGMYSVRSLAGVLTDIQYLTSDALYEAKSEGDGSVVPAALLAWLKDGALILQAMTQEETSEMLAGLDAMAPPAPVVPDDVAMAAQADEIRKALSETTSVSAYIEAAKPYMDEEEVGKALFADGKTLADNKAALTEVIAKAGARNSKADQSKVQAMHDNSVELGADCKMGKSANAEDIKKVADLESDILKLTDERDSLTKRVKELEDQPAPAKAVLRIVNKVEDVITDDNAAKIDGPVLKSDGTIDAEATALQEIKKMHLTGGVRFLR